MSRIKKLFMSIIALSTFGALAVVASSQPTIDQIAQFVVHAKIVPPEKANSFVKSLDADQLNGLTQLIARGDLKMGSKTTIIGSEK